MRSAQRAEDVPRLDLFETSRYHFVLHTRRSALLVIASSMYRFTDDGSRAAHIRLLLYVIMVMVSDDLVVCLLLRLRRSILSMV